ncbi:MAG: hypothetical protein GY841_15645 [FCB group bacterium]|nr:hypothetical protein [FCB group bacterium]
MTNDEKELIEMNEGLIELNKKLIKDCDKLAELNLDLLDLNTVLKQRIIDIEDEKGIIPENQKKKPKYLN